MIQRFLNKELQSWEIALIAMAGLLLTIAAAGLVGLAINDHVRDVTKQAIEIDVELEDRGDDFRVAVLDMRHFHRNITFAGPSRGGLADFDAAYRQLNVQINRLEELEVDDPRLPSPEALRETAETYYAEFRPVIDLYDQDRRAFTLASDMGLLRISEMEDAARTIDQLGEIRAAEALRAVDTAATSAQLVLLTVLGSLTLTGAGLTYLVIRTVREQQRASTELADALQLRNDFIADASHELRTPLTVLRANAELALQADSSLSQEELLEEILGESERMSRLVDDLLFLAGSDAGSLPLELELVDCNLFLQRSAERARVLLREHGLHLHRDLQATGLTTIDPSRIEQTILILIDNAGKYCASGTNVTLRSRSEQQTLIIEVEDEGPGIPAEDLPYIFERFYRVDKSRSRKQGGAGLGLAIARSIVEAHKGIIETESVIDRGTTMRVVLPLTQPDVAEQQWHERLSVRKAT